MTTALTAVIEVGAIGLKGRFTHPQNFEKARRKRKLRIYSPNIETTGYEIAKDKMRSENQARKATSLVQYNQCEQAGVIGTSRAAQIRIQDLTAIQTQSLEPEHDMGNTSKQLGEALIDRNKRNISRQLEGEYEKKIKVKDYKHHVSTRKKEKESPVRGNGEVKRPRKGKKRSARCKAGEWRTNSARDLKKAQALD
ncbi:hypothetical protein BJ508DRAFT_304975 [Ascobolus immersus RN42]|uniref:Uncharacterized protein n=1 Tax=Ascobolus immersus RN42 TaxID=1160509 RepID=A0A3N4INS2_ASCIM|nr:hypothetical protein BJ508DRAFT_304975 [Ascobolus immersus RN42]